MRNVMHATSQCRSNCAKHNSPAFPCNTTENEDPDEKEGGCDYDIFIWAIGLPLAGAEC
jgi:hypothetical protein